MKSITHLNHEQRQQVHHTPFKMDIRCFEGSNTLGWIFKTTQFVNFHNTPKQHRVSITFFYLDGPTLSWYHWVFNNNQLTSLNNFLQPYK